MPPAVSWVFAVVGGGVAAVLGKALAGEGGWLLAPVIFVALSLALDAWWRAGHRGQEDELLPRSLAGPLPGSERR